MDKDLERYYTKGKNGDTRYNYDLLPLIKDFSFFDFCASADSDEHGGFLVITNHQFIVGYNRGYGTGTHSASFARVMKDIHGGGEIRNDTEAVKLDIALEKEALEARIVYEIYEDNDNSRIEQGYIHFNMGYHKKTRLITHSQYEQFLKFYEKYNEEIKYVCRRFNFFVTFYTYNENGKGNLCESNSLDELKEYMSKHLTDDVIVDNEVILNDSKTK